MAIFLSGKVVALHLDNNTAKACLCNQGSAESLAFQACLLLIESDQQAWYKTHYSIHTYPSHCVN